ncbi:DMT family transporter [Legionella nagasakiensis]|uniref:DMT family transporter n=1 Tax=Legionella nagasakiensis TaxID=535290 RepID=UPI0013EF5C8F|nr:DMT family transporter [Legionella nagasakiensis]
MAMKFGVDDKVHQDAGKTKFNHGETIALGILFSLLSFLCLSFMGALAKAVSSYASTAVVVFIQNFVSVILILPFILYSGIRQLKTQRIGMHFFRAFTGSAAWYCLFLAIPVISLTNATLLLYSAPLWMPVLGFFFFKEEVGSKVWSGVLVGFIGVILVLQPGKDFFHPQDFIALIGAILMSFALFSVRWLRATEPVIRILFYYFSLSTLIFLPLALLYWRMPTTLLPWCYLIAIGIMMALSQLFITMAYKHASAVRLSPYIYSVIIFSALLDWFIWGNTPNRWEIGGIVLVIVGGITASLESKKSSELTKNPKVKAKRNFDEKV